MIDQWDCWGNLHIKNSSFVIIISDPSHMVKWAWSIYKWWNVSDLKEDGSTKRTHPQQTYNDDNDKDCSSQQTNIPIISGERVWCYFRQQAGSQDLQCNRRQTVCVDIPQCNECISDRWGYKILVSKCRQSYFDCLSSSFHVLCQRAFAIFCLALGPKPSPMKLFCPFKTSTSGIW